MITQTNLLIIKNQDVRELMDFEKAKQIILDTYILHEKQQTILPNSIFLKPDNRNRIIGLPAYVKGEVDALGIKWVASFPGNVNNNLHRASAIIILNDIKTGYPYCVFEGTYISFFRTSCGAYLVAEKLFQGRKINQIGIVGAGDIANSFLECFRIFNSLQSDKFKVYDINPEQSKKFIKKNHLLPESISDNIEDVLQSSDLIIFATTAGAPHVFRNYFSHNPVILNISLRDIASDIIMSSFNIVDDIDHINKENTSINLTYKDAGNLNFIKGTIAQLLLNELAVDANKPIIISPFGLGILDIAIAKYIYEMAIIKSKGLNIDDFFSE